jgi:hypothetical protein
MAKSPGISLEQVTQSLGRPVVQAPFAVHKPDGVVVVRGQACIEGVLARPQPHLIIRSLSHAQDHEGVGVELGRIAERGTTIESRDHGGCAPLVAEAIEI